MEERKRMLKERKKRKRRQRLLERKNRVDASLVAELKEETKRMERQREMYAYLSRKYYDRWCSLLKTKEKCKIRKSVCMPEQRKVRINRPVFIIRTSLLNVDVFELLYKLVYKLMLLQSIHSSLSSRWFSCVWKSNDFVGFY